MKSIFIGIDLGTSGCRGIAINNANTIVARSAITLPGSQRKDGHIAQNPHDWWLACHLVLDNLIEQIPRKLVKSISIAGTSGSVLLCDSDGKLRSDAYMYNDNNNIESAAQIKQTAPKESTAHGATSGLAKCLSLLKKYQPGKHVKCLTQADWIAGILTNQYNFSDQNNSLKLGYDAIAQQWPDWIQTLGCQDHLAENIYPPGSPYGSIAPQLAKAFNLPKSTQIVAGTTDSVAAFLATGCNKPGDAVTSLGSTLAIKLLSEHPIYAPEYGVYSHRLGNHWLVGGASNTGGAVIKKYFSSTQIADLSKLLQTKKTTGLNYYPLLEAGERFPISNNKLSPKLTPRPDSDLTFFQGILEGITNIEKSGYETLTTLGANYPTQIETMGGGSVNTAWQTMRQQALGVPISKATITDAAFGAALLAKQGIQ